MKKMTNIHNKLSSDEERKKARRRKSKEIASP